MNQMRSMVHKPWPILTSIAALLVGLSFLGATVAAQEEAPNAAQVAEPEPQVGKGGAPGTEVAEQAGALNRLAEGLARRRAELDSRRRALARDRDLIALVDLPAGEAELALWRERNATIERLRRDIEALQAIQRLLTPEALQSVSRPTGHTENAFRPDIGLSRASIEVNLRVAPKEPPFVSLIADTIVARLVTDTGSGWSLVVSPSGIGFVPKSQLEDLQ